MIALVVSRGWLPHLFSGDPAVHSIAQSTLLLIAGAMVSLLPALSLCCSRPPRQLHLPQLGPIGGRKAAQHGVLMLPGSWGATCDPCAAQALVRQLWALLSMAGPCPDRSFT